MISSSMRDVLLEHIDGRGVEILSAGAAIGLDAVQYRNRAHTVSALMHRGLLKVGRPSLPDGSPLYCKATYTFITDAGRAALAKLLAEYAETLIRAGYSDFTTAPVWAPRRRDDDDRREQALINPYMLIRLSHTNAESH